jgi:hypothetical protein
MVDLLFADGDDGLKSILRCVRDSKDKVFVEEIEKRLEDQVKFRDENKGVIDVEKERVEHSEFA